VPVTLLAAGLILVQFALNRRASLTYAAGVQ